MSRIKVSDFIFKLLYKNSSKNIFLVPGGGNMHLVDAVKRNKKIKYTSFFHEQSACIAAEAYSRINNNLGVALVTSGPGSTNAVTAVAGAFIESIPLIVISGQVKTNDLKKKNIRQNGPQEVDISNIVKPITKFCITIKNLKNIKKILFKAIELAKSGRNGPIWIDIPLDIQSSEINYKKNDIKIINQKKIITSVNYKKIINLISKSKNPLILAGHGIRLSDAKNEFVKFINKTKIPFMTTWNGIDLMEYKHYLNLGSPGIVARRSSNFVIQKCDLLVIIGSSVNNIITAFNPNNFAKNAKTKILVDNDIHQLRNNKIKSLQKFHIDCGVFLKKINKILINKKIPSYINWTNQCIKLKIRFSNEIYNKSRKLKVLDHYYVTKKLSENFSTGDKIITGSSGLAIEIFYTFFESKKNQRIFLTSGLGSMGYGISASIGACISNNYAKTFCVEGDGSLMFNLQELATIKSYKLPIKIIILNNQGYASIRNTHENYFNSRFVGTGKEDGIIYPNLKDLSKGFGLNYFKVIRKNKISSTFKKFIKIKEPAILELFIKKNEVLRPKVSTIFKKNQLFSMPLEDMSPLLSLKDLKEIMGDQIDPLSIEFRK